MNECKFCGEPTHVSFCGECVRRVQAHDNPVLCTTCRTLFGKVESVTWIPQHGLEPDMRAELKRLENNVGGVVFFVRKRCPNCELLESTNEIPLSLRVSAHVADA